MEPVPRQASEAPVDSDSLEEVDLELTAATGIVELDLTGLGETVGDDLWICDEDVPEVGVGTPVDGNTAHRENSRRVQTPHNEPEASRDVGLPPFDAGADQNLLKPPGADPLLDLTLGPFEAVGIRALCCRLSTGRPP